MCTPAQDSLNREESAFHLDVQTVREIVTSQFPQLVVETVEFLTAGWDNFAYFVNGKWVVRFPKRADRVPFVLSEISVLKHLNTCLLPICIPVPQFVGASCPRFPGPFFGYECLKGITGDQFDSTIIDRSLSARNLGQFLSTLHSVALEEVSDFGLQSEELSFEEVLAETATMCETVMPCLPDELVSCCLPFLEGKCQVPDPVPMRQCVIHADLVDEHTLLDDAGRISGIIDWGDVSISDPAVDFAGFYAWLGRDFVVEMLNAYEIPVATSFIDQIAFRARCYALTTYGWSLKGLDTTHVVRLPLVRTAFEFDRTLSGSDDVMST